MSDIRYNQWLHNSGTGGVSQDAGGNIGIGTTAPLIPVGAGNTTILNVGVVTANYIYGTVQGAIEGTLDDWIVHAGDTNTKFGFPADDTYQIFTGGSARLRIKSTGQVTIGSIAATNDASGILHTKVSNATSPVVFENDTENCDVVIRTTGSNKHSILGFGDGGNNFAGNIDYDHQNNSMVFDTNGGERLNISSAGVVTQVETGTGNGQGGIRASTASAGGNAGFGFITNGTQRFSVVTIGSAGSEALRVYDVNNSAERLRIDTDGRLRIGNTTQNQYTAADDLIIGTGSGDRGLTLYSGAADAGVIAFSDGTIDTAYRSGQIIYDHSTNAMDFRTNGNYIRLKITSTGQVRIDGSTSANHGLRFTPGGWNGYDNRMGFCGTSGGDFWWSSNWDPTTGNRDHSGYATNFIRQNVPTGYISFGTGAVNASADERMRIDKDGNVTKPYQPGFCAYANGLWQPSGTGDIWVTASFTKQFDTSNDFDTSDNTFTAPVAGRYMFHFGFRHQFTQGGYVWVYLKKNGSSFSNMHVTVPQTSANMWHEAQAIFGIMSLAANDEIRPQISVNYAGVQMRGFQFSGYLLG